MFFRLKKSGERAYVQIVENKRIDGAVRQSVVATVGRADELAASGALASLLASGARLCDRVMLIQALDDNADQAGLSLTAKRIGGPLLFGKVWERLGIDAVLADSLKDRAFEFAVERAVFAATLHRLFVSGSDRDCATWMSDYDIPGVEGLDLHHFYHAMALLGEEIEGKRENALSPRCAKGSAARSGSTGRTTPIEPRKLFRQAEPALSQDSSRTTKKHQPDTMTPNRTAETVQTNGASFTPRARLTRCVGSRGSNRDAHS